MKNQTQNLIITFSIILALAIALVFLVLPQDWRLASITILTVLSGLIVLWFLYKKWPWLLVFIILPAIIVGPIATLTIRDYTYEISLAEILILASLLIFIFDKLGQPKLDIKLPRVLWALAGFIGLAIMSVLWADNFSRALIAIRVLVYHWLVLFLVVNIIKTKKDWKRALWALPTTAFLVALQLFYKVLQLGGWSTIFIPDRTQLITPVGSWVFISAIIVLCLPLSGALLLSRSQKLRGLAIYKDDFFTSGWVIKPSPTLPSPSRRGRVREGAVWLQYPGLFLMIVFSALASLFTLGKGELLSLAAGLVYFFKKQRAKKWLTGVVAVAIVALFLIFFSQYGSQFWQRISGTFSDHNTRFRIEEFKTGISVFAHQPFFGVGIGNLKLVYRAQLPWFVETESNNIIVQILAELGAIGGLILYFLVREIVSVFRSLKVVIARTDKILLLGFASTMVVAIANSMVEVTFVGLNYGIVFWYVIGLVVSRSILAQLSKLK